MEEGCDDRHEVFEWLQYAWDITKGLSLLPALKKLPAACLADQLTYVTVDVHYAETVDTSKPLLVGIFLFQQRKIGAKKNHPYAILLDGHHRLYKALFIEKTRKQLPIHLLDLDQTLDIQIRGPRPSPVVLKRVRERLSDGVDFT